MLEEHGRKPFQIYRSWVFVLRGAVSRPFPEQGRGREWGSSLLNGDRDLQVTDGASGARMGRPLRAGTRHGLDQESAPDEVEAVRPKGEPAHHCSAVTPAVPQSSAAFRSCALGVRVEGRRQSCIHREERYRGKSMSRG